MGLSISSDKNNEEFPGPSGIVHPDDFSDLMAALRRAVDSGHRIEVEHFLNRIDGIYPNLQNDPRPSEQEASAVRQELAGSSIFEGLVGQSASLRSIITQMLKVAATDSTVLITGETGTGKELIALAVHKHSQRAAREFVSVNCAAMPTTLISSELFGHERGAFTGALQQRHGRFERAHGGTIFLDEVGELPLETQVSLLRVLQERQFERVGGSRIISTDVRVIAATNRNLSAAIAAGTFRSDLFYRLNVVPIQVPALRERKEDIQMLVDYFVERFTKKVGKRISKIDEKTLYLFQRYHWPGNIRELQNVIERAVILGSSDTLSIDESWLASDQNSGSEMQNGLKETLINQEKKIIETALAASKGKIAGPNGAAARLGIPPSTLDSKIKQFGIKKSQLLFGS